MSLVDLHQPYSTHNGISPPLRVLHGLGLSQYGGVERLFKHYLAESAATENISHDILAFDRRIHSLLAPHLTSYAARVWRPNSWHGLDIPDWLRNLRRYNARRIARLSGAEVLLLWNTVATSHSRSLSRRIPLIYYDHCLTWFSPKGRSNIVPQLSGAIACSHASARVLTLHWEFPHPVRICRNTLCELPPRQIPKQPPRDRSFRIGVAGRLVGAKGMNLALYALEHLRRRNYDCELHIAGAGPQERTLRDLAQYMWLSRHVHFHGLLSDMHGFYEHIDCFCNPSLLEAFGMACLEASSHGCPVIASDIDGLPEVVDNEVTGHLIEPTVPLSTFLSELNGSADAVPPVSYDPGRDELRTPMAIDPGKLAHKIAVLMDNPDKYARMSHAAISMSNEKSSLSNYRRQLDETLASLLPSRQTEPGSIK